MISHAPTKFIAEIGYRQTQRPCVLLQTNEHAHYQWASRIEESVHTLASTYSPSLPFYISTLGLEGFIRIISCTLVT